MRDLGEHGTMVDTGHPGLETVSMVVGSSGLHCLERIKGKEMGGLVVLNSAQHFSR